MFKRWLGLSPYPALDRSTMSWHSAILGLVLNLLLFTGKLVVGLWINSVAFISDAFNNLTDSMSVIVMLIGMQFSQRAPDHDHPQGHGRGEYVTTLLIGILIAALGIQLVFSSFDRILNPVMVTWSIPSLIVLALGIIAKLALYYMNKAIYHRYHSHPHRATAQDSINDVFVTSGVLLSILVTHYMNISLDGIVGLFISGFILLSAYRISQKSIQSLLGMALAHEKAAAIEEQIRNVEGVRGVHRFASHDYGPDRLLATIHVEVDDTMSLIEAHHLIDGIEAMIERDYGIHLLIHLDPISTNPTDYERLRQELLPLMTSVDATALIDELRIVNGAVITDIILGWKTSAPVHLHSRIRHEFVEKLQVHHPNYLVDITFTIY